MNTHKLKLAIIQRVTSCEDVQLLQTIHQLLNQLDKSQGSTVDQSSDPQIIAALLGETTISLSTAEQATEQEEIEDLQRSIDDVFGL